MRPDVLDELRAADPARRMPPEQPDWDAIAARITATPPRRRRHLALVPAVAAAALAIVAVLTGGGATSAIDRAYAAISQDAIYHYTVTFQELEDGRPVPGTRSEREAWIDPRTGRIRELFASGEERVTDGGGSENVLAALTRSIRAGALRDDGVTEFEGRTVRRLVARNAEGTWTQTFLVDAETYLPVLFRSDTGGERIIEERYGTFERLPGDANPAVLERQGPPQGPQPAPAP